MVIHKSIAINVDDAKCSGFSIISCVLDIAYYTRYFSFIIYILKSWNVGMPFYKKTKKLKRIENNINMFGVYR